MMMRRLACTGLALVAMTGLSGCAQNANGADASGPPPASAAPVDARAELTAAARKLQDNASRFSVTMGDSMRVTGVADRKNRKADITMKTDGAEQSADMKIRLVGRDLYVNVGESFDNEGKQWMHTDASKIPSSSSMNVDNITDARNFLVGLGRVEKVGTGAYRGVLDITKARNADVESLAFLGDKAKAVPFTAEVDAQGRLTELVIDMAALGMPATLGSTINARYFDFGSPVTVKAPNKDQVQEMPAVVLKTLIG
jgi:hypothetical protein